MEKRPPAPDFASRHVERGTGKRQPWSRGPAFELPGLPMRRSEKGSHAVELVDATGEIIDRHRFDPQFVDVEGTKLNSASFRIRLPADRARDVRGVRLRRGAQVLDRIVVSQKKPTVNIPTPGGEGGGAGGPWSAERALIWDTGDDAFDSTAIVLYSPDGGDSWFPAARRVRGRSAKIDTDRLPGGRRGKFRVIVSDGFNTAQADTNFDIEIGNKAPRVQATFARHVEEVVAGDLVGFRGRARDLEDGVLDGDQLVWSIEGRVIGVGDKVRTRLPDGEWVVQLEATDTDGVSSVAKVTVLVHPREGDEPEGPVFQRRRLGRLGRLRHLRLGPDAQLSLPRRDGAELPRRARHGR